MRQQMFDALTVEQTAQLTAIADAILALLEPEGVMTAPYRPDVPSTTAEPLHRTFLPHAVGAGGHQAGS